MCSLRHNTCPNRPSINTVTPAIADRSEGLQFFHCFYVFSFFSFFSSFFFFLNFVLIFFYFNFSFFFIFLSFFHFIHFSIFLFVFRFCGNAYTISSVCTLSQFQPLHGNTANGSRLKDRLDTTDI